MKYKLQQITHGTHSYSSPTIRRARKNDSQVGETPQHYRTGFSDSPLPRIKHQHRGRSQSPSPSSLEQGNHETKSPRRKIQNSGNQNDETPSTFRTNRTHNQEASSPQSNRTGRDSRPRAQDIVPTLITPPIDPKFTPAFVEATNIENRRRSGQYPKFSTNIHEQVDIKHDGATSIRKSIEDTHSTADTSSSDEIDETNSETESDTGTSSEGSTDSDVPSNPSFSDDSDAMDVDERQTKNTSRAENHSSQHDEEPGSNRVKPAMMGRELVNELQRKEKERMERAANKVIEAIAPSPKKKKSQASILSSRDQKALDSLYRVIPSHVLTRAQEMTNKKMKAGRQPKKEQVQNIRHPAVILAAAYQLILQLSGSNIGVGDGGASNNADNIDGVDLITTKRNEALVQGELVRILRERDQKITALELQVRSLTDRANTYSSMGD